MQWSSWKEIKWVEGLRRRNHGSRLFQTLRIANLYFSRAFKNVNNNAMTSLKSKRKTALPTPVIWVKTRQKWINIVNFLAFLHNWDPKLQVNQKNSGISSFFDLKTAIFQQKLKIRKIQILTMFQGWFRKQMNFLRKTV